MWRGGGGGSVCRVTHRGQQAQDLQRGIADLETNPNTCRRDCHPEPHRGLHSSRQREQETGSQHRKERHTAALRCGALISRCNGHVTWHPLLLGVTWGDNKVQRWALTLRGQSSGVTGRRGQTESSGERLCRPGHHTYTVNVSGWELPPPRWTSEVFVIALKNRRTSHTFRRTLWKWCLRDQIIVRHRPFIVNLRHWNIIYTVSEDVAA